MAWRQPNHNKPRGNKKSGQRGIRAAGGCKVFLAPSAGPACHPPISLPRSLRSTCGLACARFQVRSPQTWLRGRELVWRRGRAIRRWCRLSSVRVRGGCFRLPACVCAPWDFVWDAIVCVHSPAGLVYRQIRAHDTGSQRQPSRRQSSSVQAARSTASLMARTGRRPPMSRKTTRLQSPAARSNTVSLVPCPPVAAASSDWAAARTHWTQAKGAKETAARLVSYIG